MRSEYMHKQELGHLLAALMPPNRLAMEISMSTGLRISDVLNIRTNALLEAKDRRMTVKELKTGKRRLFTLPVELYSRAIAMAGKLFLFEGRNDWKKPRTRQAVYKDVRRIADAFRLKVHVSPHTARKTFAVGAYERSGDLKKVQKLLNHSSEAVTLLYALADQQVRKRKS